MLDFKMEKHYEDTEGHLWKFCGYVKDPKRDRYYFQLGETCPDVFYEQPDNSVTEWRDGNGIKIPFVKAEILERDWVVGEEYECYDAITKKIRKAKLTNLDKSNEAQQYEFQFYDGRYWLYGKGDIACYKYYVVFKNGIPQELKDRINKDKLTNKRKSFQKGQVYKDISGSGFIFIKRVKTSNGLFAIFEICNTGGLYAAPLKKINNVECTTCDNKIDLCADESIRNEDAEKTVRIKE